MLKNSKKDQKIPDLVLEDQAQAAKLNRQILDN